MRQDRPRTSKVHERRGRRLDLREVARRATARTSRAAAVLLAVVAVSTSAISAQTSTAQTSTAQTGTEQTSIGQASSCPAAFEPGGMAIVAEPDSSLLPAAWSRSGTVGCAGTAAPDGFLPGGWLRSEYSSTLSDRPDGLLAPAKGLTVSAVGGFSWTSGRLELRVAPQVAWHQNADIDVPPGAGSVDPGSSEFRYPWLARRIDWPLRHGSEAFASVDPGQSGLRLAFGAFSSGLDAASFRWGPSLRYPLLISGYGPSLPRLDLRSDRPLSMGGAGELSFHLLYGLLDESEWFDDDASNDQRIVAGMSVAWAPPVLTGLELGLAAIRHLPRDDFGPGDLLGFIQAPVDDVAGNAEGNGLGSFWLRWASPDGRIRAWAEWGKDDYGESVTDFLLEPEHSSARTLGFRYEARQAEGSLVLHLESTTTELADPRFEGGRLQAFYTHTPVTQGHTQRGQMLGTHVGPGGSGQFASLGWVGASTSALEVERVRWNEDHYVRVLADDLGIEGHDVELVGRLRHERAVTSRLRGRVAVEVGARHNRLFLQDDPGWEGQSRVSVSVIWVN